MLEEKILAIRAEALEKINHVKTDIFEIEKKYLGRKSEFVSILKALKDLSPEEKKKIGELANRAKQEIMEVLEKKKAQLQSASFDFEKERIDITIPGKKQAYGHLHILSTVQKDIEDIFTSMGFEIADGPEIEIEHYNFDQLNIPKDHPGRDMQDTFWLKAAAQSKKVKTGDISERTLLRTQTSPVQVRYMESNTPPFRIIVPGRVFRNEATDASHEHTFNQFEALVVGDDISVGNFKYIAQKFFSEFFGQKMSVRLRPGYFPFVEPGFEFDISCTVCGGRGCSSCKHTGWLEIGGCGMVNQSVFVSAGYPRNKYQGFAWGFGLERLAMMKYKISDARLFESGDLRFIKQF
ncbi:MAG: phenylalanine--tRNA ligase subunit alpha [Parcubacteria group bacterium]|jgi:phenylalanyl-tRNA synthetase alpha chain